MISFEFPKEVEYGNYNVNFVNLLGEVVSETLYVNSDNQQLISDKFLDLVEGLYLVQIFNGQGELIQTTKLIKEYINQAYCYKWSN